MQEVTETYRAIVSGPYQTEVKVIIGDTEYGMDKLVSLNTSRATLGTGTPKLGSAVSREIDLTVYAESENIPRMAAVKPYVRVYNGVSDSEWISKGVFYIDTRQQNQDTLTIHGYDAMMLAEAQYPESDLDWPATDIEVVQEIADALDVDIDERTLALITQQFPIQMPDQYVTDDGETPDMGDVFTMRDVLAGIAGLYGGVFLFNDLGELQLLCPWDAPEETNYLTTENGDYITFGGTRILLSRELTTVVKTASGSIVHVTDALEEAVDDLVVTISLVQSGSGTPSLSNVRSISGWTGANVRVERSYNTGATPKASVSWQTEAGTVCNGTLDVTTGLLTVNGVFHEFAIADMNNSDTFPGWKNQDWVVDIAQHSDGAGYAPTGSVCNINTYSKSMYNVNRNSKICYLARGLYGMTQTEWKANYPDLVFQVYSPLATPQTYQLTATEVSTLMGENYIWADTGDVSVDYYAYD